MVIIKGLLCCFPVMPQLVLFHWKSANKDTLHTQTSWETSWIYACHTHDHVYYLQSYVCAYMSPVHNPARTINPMLTILIDNKK